MAQRLIWTAQSLDDIDAIAEHIHPNSPYYASRVVERIFAVGDSIPAQPMMGRMVPEYN